MANRKLQKDIEIIFKKIHEGLHDFNYHYDRYESINTDDDSDNQREKEKLEGDLKKEIKRLQKFREQIKNWQLNDVIKTLGPSGTALGVKLNDNKKLIEEAMETYKDVERLSKLKTFSNQSIMMTFLDSQLPGDDDDDDDTDEDFWERLESSDEDEEEELEDLPSEAIDAIHYFKDTIQQIREQTTKLNHEFEKLALKKLRKNNLTTIEAKKEKIKATISTNKFHCKKMLKLIRLLKAGQVTDFNLVWLLKDDLDGYVESNGDSNFSSETTLYDDVFNLIVAAVEEDYSEMHDFQEENNDASVTEETATQLNGTISNHETTPTTSTAVNGNNNHHHHQKTSVHSSPTATKVNGHGHESPYQQKHHQTHQRQHRSPELTSPAIVRTLKPATTPSKPVGNLKWSTAAAVGKPENKPVEPEQNGAHEKSPQQQQQQQPESESQTASPATTVASTATQESVPKRQSIVVETVDLDKYKEIIKSSPLLKPEVSLFSDMSLVRVPPGIQDLVISFAAKRNNQDTTLLVDSKDFNQYTTPIHKPYLPDVVQPIQFTHPSSFKHPTQLVKFQNYWNQVRAVYGFDKLSNDIKALIAQDKPENVPIIAELTFVFFYGFYYGLTPAENLIAESYLYELGWKPYKTQLNNNASSPLQISSPNQMNEGSKANYYFYWFKRTKLISQPDEVTEFGDYQVFDLNFWEIFMRYGFKFDYSLCQLNPSTSIF